MEMVDCRETENHNWEAVLRTLSDGKITKQMASQGVPEPWELTNEDKKTIEAAIEMTRKECCGARIQEKLTRNCTECGPGIEIQEQLKPHW